LRGTNGIEESECLKARTSDLSESRKSDFNLSPSLGVKDTSSKNGGNLALALTPEKDKDRASPIGVGVSLENLTLDTTCGSGSGLGSEGKKRTRKLSSLEVMRAALQSIDIHNWSLFA
jgi:hypothetical protein